MNTSKRMVKRILIIIVAVIFLTTGTGARIFYLSVVKGEELSAKAEAQQLKDAEISAMRGTIYDSDGNVLAKSASVWNVFIDPLNIKTEKKRNLIVNKLSSLFKYDDKERQTFLKRQKTTIITNLLRKKSKTT